MHYGIDIDDEGTVLFMDHANHCVIAKKASATKIELVAGGNEDGDEVNQVRNPSAIIIDNKTKSLIVRDYDNRRIVRWACYNGTKVKILITEVLALDDEQALYVANLEKGEVRKY